MFRPLQYTFWVFLDDAIVDEIWLKIGLNR